MTGPRPSGLITLLTDFGVADPFVGVMKGVIFSRAPRLTVVDLCHGIRPQAVRQAAFWLERCYRWFPAGSVHVTVVDPTVGSARGLLAAHFGEHYFLAPDNGTFSAALLSSPGARVLGLDPERLGLPQPSATFHGRDVFAPLAADLASGVRSFEELGDPVLPVPSALAAPVARGDVVSGEIVTLDHYGNLISNLDESWIGDRAAAAVHIAGRRLPLLRTYADAEPGALVALVNSFGVIEIAERDGHAARRLGVGPGAIIELCSLAASSS